MIKTPSTGSPYNQIDTQYDIYTTTASSMAAVMPPHFAAYKTTKSYFHAFLNAIAMQIDEIYYKATGARYNAIISTFLCSTTEYGLVLVLPEDLNIRIKSITLGSTTLIIQDYINEFLNSMLPSAYVTGNVIYFRNLALEYETTTITGSAASVSPSLAVEPQTPFFYSVDDYIGFEVYEPEENPSFPVSLTGLDVATGTLSFCYYPEREIWVIPEDTINIKCTINSIPAVLHVTADEMTKSWASTGIIRNDQIIVDELSGMVEPEDKLLVYNEFKHEEITVTSALGNKVTPDSISDFEGQVFVHKLVAYPILFRNGLDVIGNNLALPRIQYEKNYSYRDRLVAIHIVPRSNGLPGIQLRAGAPFGHLDVTSALLYRAVLAANVADGSSSITISGTFDGDYLVIGNDNIVREVSSISGTTINLVSPVTGTSYSAGEPVMSAVALPYPSKNVLVIRDSLVPETMIIQTELLYNIPKTYKWICPYNVCYEGNPQENCVIDIDGETDRVINDFQEITNTLSEVTTNIYVATPSAFSTGDYVVIAKNETRLFRQVDSVSATYVTLTSAVNVALGTGSFLSHAALLQNDDNGSHIDLDEEASSVVADFLIRNWSLIDYMYVVFNPFNFFPSNVSVFTTRVTGDIIDSEYMELASDAEYNLITGEVNKIGGINYGVVRWKRMVPYFEGSNMHPYIINMAGALEE